MTDSSKLWIMQIWRKWLPFWAKREPARPNMTVRARLRKLPSSSQLNNNGRDIWLNQTSRFSTVLLNVYDKIDEVWLVSFPITLQLEI